MRHMRDSAHSKPVQGRGQFATLYGFAFWTYSLRALGTAYEFANGERLASGDCEGGKSGAVRVVGDLGSRSGKNTTRRVVSP